MGQKGTVLFLIALLCATPAHADHGALSVDVAAGGAALSLAAPYAPSGGHTFVVDFEAMLGLRYAVTNELEFTLAGYFEPQLGYSEANVPVTLPPSSKPVSGTVAFSLSQFGVVAGIRYVQGSVWKLVVGLEGGWNHRSYSGIQFAFASGQPNLPSFGTDNIVLQPLVGVEFAFADHWSLSLLSRFTVLIGPDATVGASLMLSISYSWFL
jgi:hypothetical protein